MRAAILTTGCVANPAPDAIVGDATFSLEITQDADDDDACSPGTGEVLDIGPDGELTHGCEPLDANPDGTAVFDTRCVIVLARDRGGDGWLEW